MKQKISIVHIGPVEWFNYKEDIIYGLYHGFRENKNEVKILNNQFDVNSINIIIGSDWLIQDKNFIEFINSNLKYYIFEVEKFDGSTINDRKYFNIKDYKELIHKSLGIITPYYFNYEEFKTGNYLEEGNVHYLKWGFYDELIDSNVVRNQERHLYGTFFGLLKGERLLKANKLKEIHGENLMFLGRENPHSFKAAALSASNYSISLSYGDTEKFVNPFRLFYLYANKIRVISDSIVDQDGYLDFAIKTNFSILCEAIKHPPTQESDILELIRNSRLADNINKLKLII